MATSKVQRRKICGHTALNPASLMKAILRRSLRPLLELMAFGLTHLGSRLVCVSVCTLRAFLRARHLCTPGFSVFPAFAGLHHSFLLLLLLSFPLWPDLCCDLVWRPFPLNVFWSTLRLCIQCSCDLPDKWFQQGPVCFVRLECHFSTRPGGLSSASANLSPSAWYSGADFTHQPTLEAVRELARAVCAHKLSGH